MTISDHLIEYLDNSLKFLITTFMADAIRRIFLAIREYVIYPKYYHYEMKLLKILKYAFTFSGHTIILIILTSFVALWRFRNNSYFVVELCACLPYMPLYWLCCSMQLSYSTLDYAYWIRRSHGLDYATGMASNYFHGYLNLTMPASDHPGIRERIKLYSAKNRVQFAVDRLIILIPNTMFVNSQIKSKYLERAAPLDTIMINRAGVHRPFKNDVYRITKPINGTFYYVAMEGATPMLSFFEAMHNTLSATWQMKAMSREIVLKFYKTLKMLLNEWPKTQEECELIFYNAYTDDGKPQDVGEVLIGHIANVWQQQRPLTDMETLMQTQ